MTPKLTVLMPVYNGERFLKEAIESILSQTFSDYEFLIIDDNSCDKSKDIILSFRDKRIRFIQNKENLGQARTLNIGIGISSGIYIARIDQDDRSLPVRFEKEIGILEQFSKIGLVYSNSFIINEDGTRQEKTLFDYAKPSRLIVFEELLKRNFITGNTTMLKRNIFADIGLYNPAYQIASEYDFLLRLTHKYNVGFINEPLAEYRVHRDNSSANSEKTFQEVIEVLKNLRQNVSLKKRENKIITKVISWYLATLGMHYLFQHNKQLCMTKAKDALKVNLLSTKAFAVIAIATSIPSVLLDRLNALRRQRMCNNN